jgi:glycyl-tRNA synthetase beta chain
MVRHKLVPVAIGLDGNGKATAVLQKKLAALGVDDSVVPQLVRASDGKAEVLFLDLKANGIDLATGLQRALDEALAKLPIPKVMTYQEADGWTPVRFVRPAHRLVALHGDQVVPVRALGLTAGRTTQGHRFASAASSRSMAIAHADAYAETLRSQGGVLASFAERRAAIRSQLAAAGGALGLRAIDDDELLDEVTGLVEQPHVLTCSFEPEFLEVPAECLILTMKQNQKYFPLLDGNGRLTHRFLVVANIGPADASAIIGGNERVVRPRLADARFFFEQDRKKPLSARVPGLDKVVYHQKLGSQGERVERLRSIACSIGQAIGGEALAQLAERAAMLAKADLLTDMVGEFPELQGIMGGYYASHDGEPGAIADAITDHYRPRFAGDQLPRNEVGVAVALADKLETLVGLFGIGQVPTGDKDPFALRRHALGVLRLVLEKRLPLRLDALIGMAVPVFGARITDPTAALVEFCFERLAGMLREQGFTALEVDAVLSLRPLQLTEVPLRLAAVRAFAALPQAAALAAANKRIGNILKKSQETLADRIEEALLQDAAEQRLFAALATTRGLAEPLYERGDYTGALLACAELRGPVDDFFTAVMVNAEDERLRRNRLALLRELHRLMNRTADLARLAT